MKKDRCVVGPARSAAYEALCRIELKNFHSDDVLNSDLVSPLEVRDRNLTIEIVFGTLRWRGWLDHILAQAIARDWRSVDLRALILLRLSLYQMARMDRIPDHALIHDAVEMAKSTLRPGGGGFINGILRNLGRTRPWRNPEFHRDCPIWVRVSLPQWLWHRWETRYGVDCASEYALSLNRAPRPAFRFGRHASSHPMAPDPPIQVHEGEGGKGETDPYGSELVPGAYLAADSSQAPRGKDARFQDEASQLIPYLLGPVEGLRIWDACAAPGGKAAILRENGGASGRLIASDRNPARAVSLKSNLSHVEGSACAVLILDVRSQLPFRQQFDAVLADVPCSGLGTLRRNPELKWRLEEARLPELGHHQQALLDSISAAVGIGGRLLYATCSTEPEENEEVVAAFLASHPSFQLSKPSTPPGIAPWLDRAGMFRSYPGARLWDGFFAALMVRTS